MNGSYEIIIDDIEQFLYFIGYFIQQHEEWIFRGQSDAEWTLISSLERCFQKFGLTEKTAQYKSEQEILEMGERYLSSIPEVSCQIVDKLDLLAYIQHYGGATRLLDFTDSFSIASFMAVENFNRESDAAVWCLRRKVLNTGNYYTNRESRKEFAEKILTNGEHEEDIFSFAPYRLNQRIIAQQGLFVMPTVFSKNSIMGILSKKFQIDLEPKLISPAAEKFNKHLKDAVLLKFIFDKKLLRDIQISLKKMNISASTLFPGEEGLCRELKLLASGYRENRERFHITGGDL